MRGKRRNPKRPSLFTLNLPQFHQPSNPLATNSHTVSLELRVDRGAAIAATAFAVNLSDLFAQRGVGFGACAEIAFPPRVISGLRYLEVPAERDDPVLPAMRFNKRKPQRDSLAKKAAAFFKISLSSLAWASSLRSRAISASAAARLP